MKYYDEDSSTPTETQISSVNVLGNGALIGKSAASLVVVGNEVIGDSQNSVAVGDMTVILGDQSVALGYGSYVGTPKMRGELRDLKAVRDTYIASRDVFDAIQSEYYGRLAEYQSADAVFQSYQDELNRRVAAVDSASLNVDNQYARYLEAVAAGASNDVLTQISHDWEQAVTDYANAVKSADRNTETVFFGQYDSASTDRAQKLVSADEVLTGPAYRKASDDIVKAWDDY